MSAKLHKALLQDESARYSCLRGYKELTGPGVSVTPYLLFHNQFA